MGTRLWTYYVCGICGCDVERVPAGPRFHALTPVELDDGAVAAQVVTSLCVACRVFDEGEDDGPVTSILDQYGPFIDYRAAS